MDWAERAAAASARYRNGESRLGGTDDDPRQRQLTRLGNTAWATGLSLLMDRRHEEANGWLRRAAERYRESWRDAPPDSWGRPIGAMKALLVAGDDPVDEAHWALDAGAADAASPIGRYAGTLALLVLGRDADALELAAAARPGRLPVQDVAALTALAAADRSASTTRCDRGRVLDSFETRGSSRTSAVADTVLAPATRPPRGQPSTCAPCPLPE